MILVTFVANLNHPGKSDEIINDKILNMNLKLYSSLDRVRVSSKNLSIEASGRYVRTFVIAAFLLLFGALLAPLFMRNANN